MQVKVKRTHKDAIPPKYMTPGAAGFDLYACESCDIFPNAWKQVRTGLIFEIPEGYEMQIRPRSGLALQYPSYILNSPGTVDSDYRGEVMICIQNTRNKWMYIKQGDRIAQGIITPVKQVELVISNTITKTERGNNGFGSTGGITTEAEIRKRQE